MANFKKVGEVTCLKVILGYRNLSKHQQESLEEQGILKEDFPCPESEQFFSFEGSVFSENKDCIPVTRFNSLYRQYEYHLCIKGWWYAVNFESGQAYLQQVEI